METFDFGGVAGAERKRTHEAYRNLHIDLIHDSWKIKLDGVTKIIIYFREQVY